jgi:hypothetical protein
MAVYGPVRHQKNNIWTEASDLYLYGYWRLTQYCYVKIKLNMSYNVIIINTLLLAGAWNILASFHVYSNIYFFFWINISIM